MKTLFKHPAKGWLQGFEPGHPGSSIAHEESIEDLKLAEQKGLGAAAASIPTTPCLGPKHLSPALQKSLISFSPRFTRLFRFAVTPSTSSRHRKFRKEEPVK